VSLRGLPLALVACLCGHARAERSVQVVADGAPFSPADLANALRVRLPDQGAAVAVHVQAAGDRVTVAIGDTTRDVELGGRTGPDAARLVALAVVDLALDDLAVMPRSEPAPGSIVTLGLLGSATAWASVLAGPTADVAIARGRWLFALDVTGDEHVSGDLGVASAPVHACVGMRLDQLELRGGAVVVPMWVSNGSGDQTTLLGLTASARLRLAITPTVHLVAAVGIDGYATQTVYHLGMGTITTPWFAPWLAAGMEVRP
jgi:hypothetical protein